MVKVKTLQIFEDLKENVLRKPETETAVFECSEERYEHLFNVLPHGYIELLEEVQEEDKTTAEEAQEVLKEKPKAKTSKKK